MLEDEVITTMHQFKKHSRTANMRRDRVVMTVLSVDSSWFDYPMLLLCNFTNSGHDGFAIKMFGLAVLKSLLHLSAATWCPDSSRFRVLQPPLYADQAALNIR